MLYTESDLEKSMDKIETIHFHQVLILLALFSVLLILFAHFKLACITGTFIWP